MTCSFQMMGGMQQGMSRNPHLQGDDLTRYFNLPYPLHMDRMQDAAMQQEQIARMRGIRARLREDPPILDDSKVRTGLLDQIDTPPDDDRFNREGEL